MRSRPWLRAALAAAVLTIAARPASGSLVLALDLEALTARADRVVVAEVLSVTPRWDERRERILSTVEVRVSEVWKGLVPGDGRLVFVQPGGVLDGIETRVHGLPVFSAGERAVLFLRGDGPRAFGLVGLGQGKRPLRFDTETSRWVVDGGDRSAAVVRDARGRLSPAPPEPAVPLEELRRRVRALVGKPAP